MFVVFFKQKTAYEMRISDWSSDVCSSDLEGAAVVLLVGDVEVGEQRDLGGVRGPELVRRGEGAAGTGVEFVVLVAALAITDAPVRLAVAEGIAVVEVEGPGRRDVQAGSDLPDPVARELGAVVLTGTASLREGW